MAMTLRLPEELDAKLTALAAQQRRSKQQVVGSAVEEYLERLLHAERTQRNLQRVLRENAELLEDLART